MPAVSPLPWYPSPVELGFPEKFADWRDDQLRAIEKVVSSSKRFIALTMPTGSGKSLTYTAAARLLPGDERAVILTSTKGLQDQLNADFRSVGLRDVRGQRNYPCSALVRGGPLDRYRRGRLDPGCDEGPCHVGVRCPYAPERGAAVRPDCSYYGAVHDAARSDLVVTNYAYWLAAQKYAQGIGKFGTLILDEAHHAADELENFLAFEITQDDCTRAATKMMDSPDVTHWRAWARQHLGPLKVAVEIREANPPMDALGVAELKLFKSTLAKLDRLATVKPDDWVLDLTDPRHAAFTPLRAADYAEEMLFKGIPKVILTSATLTAKTLHLLGIPREDATVWECPSRFPVARRPIVHVGPQPEVRVTHRMSDAHKLLWRRRIDRLIAPRLDRKGIIHTVSYQRMKDLLEHSEHREHFITHDSGNTLQAVAEFKRRKEPAILLSPSLMTGYDFPYDECRWQIIGKVPLLDTRTPLLQVRKDTDPDYAFYVTMQKLVQAVGRGMRAPDDWCETFIVDDSFEWFVRRARKFAPKWFLEAVEWTSSLPSPLDPSKLP
jgi:Rad3-related DNA helicase